MQTTNQDLQLEERSFIQNVLEHGYKPSAAIALSLGRSPSTICRELSRKNYITPSTPRQIGQPFLAGNYSCVRAN